MPSHERPSSVLRAGALLACLMSGGCSSDEPTDNAQDAGEKHNAEPKAAGAKANIVETAQETKTSAAQTAPAQQRPVTTIPTTLSITLDDNERSAPASARLQIGVDGAIEFSALSNAPKEMFSLRLAIPSSDTPLRKRDFEFAPGVPQATEIVLIRGELPNATSLRSVGGTAKFEHFDKETLELKFDVELSADPLGGKEKVKATGTLLGAVSFVCLQGATSDQKNVASKPESKECRELLDKLAAE